MRLAVLLYLLALVVFAFLAFEGMTHGYDVEIIITKAGELHLKLMHP
jgi:hypothetical protein